MDLKDLITIIPELLLYYIPGYISLRIKEKYCPEKRRDEYNSTAQSIIYSFIIGIVFYFIELITTEVFKSSFFILLDQRFHQLIHLLLAVLLGFFLVRFSSSRIGTFVLKRFNKTLDPSPSVWIKALKNEEGAWATVYLRNGLIYIGKMKYYTTDPDDQKLILLYSYRLCVRDKEESTPERFCQEIKDTTTDSNSKVLLNYEDIISIEIERGTTP